MSLRSRLLNTTNKLINRIVIVLDESGSMAGLTNDVKRALKTIETTIDDASAAENQRTVTEVIRFADRVKASETLDDAQKLYRPNGGTALYDAIGQAITLLRRAAGHGDEAYMVIVLTDGEENVSRQYTQNDIRDLIRRYQNDGNWTFAFQVPPRHGHQVADQFGVPAGNVREWEPTRHGLGETTRATSVGLGSYFAGRTKGVRSVQSFYVQTDLSNVSKRDLNKLNDQQVRFRVLNVPKECRIDEFVTHEIGHYHVGSAYYQLTKTEKVQAGKQVLIMEKGKKAIYGGPEARDLVGLPNGVEAKVVPGNHSNFDIFVQSTSANRKLVRGTKLLVQR